MSLTTGIDTLTGTAGNDTFNATVTATDAVLGGLDVVDGAGGTDTLNIADTAVGAAAQFALPSGFTMSNVEKLSVATNGGINMDVSGIAGLTSITTAAAGTANTAVTAADTTDVTTTVAGAATTAIAGGKAVSATAGTGVVGVTGDALTSVSVKGGGVATIDNTLDGVTSTGTTLTSVTLDDIGGATAAIKGAAVTSLTLENQESALAVTLTNATSTALTINVDGVGYDAAGAKVVDSVAAGAAATTVTINATGDDSALTVTGAKAATINITGDAALDLAAIATATKIDGSAATGDLTLNTLNAATVTVSTGSGDDSFTLSAVKVATVNAGAGADTVTLGAILAAGSTVNLGAGNDVLLGTAKAAASTATLTTVVDGGAGVDSLSSTLVNAGNADLFVNFENLSIGAATTLDVSLISGLTGLTIDGNASGTLSEVSVSQSLTINADNGANGTTTLSFGDADGSSDSYSITFASDTDGTAKAPTTITADTIVVDGVESVTVHSGAAAGVAANSITLDGADATSLTIDGDMALTVAFSGTFGTTGADTGVTSINASAATGGITINTANVNVQTGETLALSTGSGDDVITLAQEATVNAGAGDDSIVAAAAGGTFTGGAGDDSFDVHLAVTAAAMVTIDDFTLGSDALALANKGTEVFNATAIDVSAATNLADALNLASAVDCSTNGNISWFVYGTNTYIVEDMGAGATFAATDIVVKLVGEYDLSDTVVGDFTFI